MKISKEQLLGVVRHTLSFFGGILVMKGILDEAILAELSGAVVALSGAIWSLINKSSTTPPAQN